MKISFAYACADAYANYADVYADVYVYAANAYADAAATDDAEDAEDAP